MTTIVSPYVAPGLIAGYKLPGKQYSPEGVINTVCTHLNLHPWQIKVRTRKREIIEGRHLAMYFMRTLCTMPLSSIGRHFDQDHTTVIHALRSVDNYIKTEPDFRKKIEYLTSMFSN